MKKKSKVSITYIKIYSDILTNFLVIKKWLKKNKKNYKFFYLKPKKIKFIINKSPHVDNKSKEHFAFFIYHSICYCDFLNEKEIKNLCCKFSSKFYIKIKNIE